MKGERGRKRERGRERGRRERQRERVLLRFYNWYRSFAFSSLPLKGRKMTTAKPQLMSRGLTSVEKQLKQVLFLVPWVFV